MHVDLEVLKKRPAVLLSGKLDWYWRNNKGEACTSRSRDDKSERLGDQIERDASEAPHGEKDDRRMTNDAGLEVECQILESFRNRRQEARLTDFDYKGDPFREQFLYWPIQSGGNEDEAPT